MYIRSRVHYHSIYLGISLFISANHFKQIRTRDCSARCAPSFYSSACPLASCKSRIKHERLVLGTARIDKVGFNDGHSSEFCAQFGLELRLPLRNRNRSCVVVVPVTGCGIRFNAKRSCADTNVRSTARPCVYFRDRDLRCDTVIRRKFRSKP